MRVLWLTVACFLFYLGHATTKNLYLVQINGTMGHIVNVSQTTIKEFKEENGQDYNGKDESEFKGEYEVWTVNLTFGMFHSF